MGQVSLTGKLAENVSWVLYFNRAFSLDHFDDYQKHFTVMNYADEGTDWHQVTWSTVIYDAI